MFTSDSRYFNLSTTKFTQTNGKTIIYKKRRFLPQTTALQQLAEVTIKEGDRLDNITARTLGDPLYYWQIADANNTMNPHTLIKTIGRTLKISSPSLGIINQ